jgi:hypothetical protein
MGRIMELAVELGVGALKYASNFIRTGSRIEKLIEAYTDTHTHTDIKDSMVIT